MGMNIVHKLFQAHIIEGNMRPGTMIGIRVDQALVHHEVAPLVFLALEAMGKGRAPSLQAVYYQGNGEGLSRAGVEEKNCLESACKKFGVLLSPAENGLCHFVHAERFGIPGQIFLGTDAQSVIAGALGMIAMNAGTLDMASVMAGASFHLPMPRVIKINLEGKFNPMVSASDLGLTILNMKTLRGHADKYIEFGGEAVASLSMAQRMTVAAMLAELGMRGCIFPSDKVTKNFLKTQEREKDWQPIQADEDAEYYDRIAIQLDELIPMLAVPHSPDNVCALKEMEGLPLGQVCIGGITTGSLESIVTIAKILKGKKTAEGMALYVSPASRQIFETATQSGLLKTLQMAGAVITKPEGDLCFGKQSIPVENTVSLRAGCRNGLGVSGVKSARVYLASPEAAAVSALFGELTDPRKFSAKEVRIAMPRTAMLRASIVIPPKAKSITVQADGKFQFGTLPKEHEFKNAFISRVLLKVGDRFSTDQMIGTQAKAVPLANIKVRAKHLFENVDGEFYTRAKQSKWGVIVAGDQYGQGGAKDHAVLCLLQVGVRMVIARSFESSHRRGLIHAGILPAQFSSSQEYERIRQGDSLRFKGLEEAIARGSMEVQLNDEDSFAVTFNFSSREEGILRAGGLLNFVRQRTEEVQKNLAYALN